MERSAVEPAGSVGWDLVHSIAMELDVLLAAASGYYPLGGLAPEMAALVTATPQDWREELGGLPPAAAEMLGVMETSASLAGVLDVGDYGRATLAMREMSAGSAHAGAVEIAEVAAREQTGLFEELGFAPEAAARLGRRAGEAARIAARTWRGGDLHGRFWMWMDRLYYEFYGPWRRGRAELIAEAEQRGRVVLAGRTLEDRSQPVQAPAKAAAPEPPPLDWLPPQSPLLRLPELRAALAEGRLAVRFWVEPFGLSDFWTLTRGPGGRPTVIAAFAQPGLLYENFRAATTDLAARAGALADPTRLIILRMIRHFGMVNTEIAEYLGLARPTVSIHAKVLREAGLIRSRQEGRLVRHEIVPEEVRRLFSDLERFLDLPV